MKTTAIASALVLVSLAQANAQELNLYSARHYDTDEALYSDFTAQTGIQINRIEGNADELIERIKLEGAASPADVLLTVDAGRLWRAQQAGILSNVNSDVLNERVPEAIRHPDGAWFGFSSRARLIYVNADLVDPSTIQDYEDLAKPEFAGQICIRSSTNMYNLSLMGSLIAHLGADAAEAWAEGVVANFARQPEGNDTAQLKAAAAGACGIAVANSYYYARLSRSDDADDQTVAQKLVPIFPNQDDRGTHMNISGAGVLMHAPNRDAAVLFLEYLVSESAQSYFADGNNEFSVVPGINEKTAAFEVFGEFRQDDLNVSALGENQALASTLFDIAGWR